MVTPPRNSTGPTQNHARPPQYPPRESSRASGRDLGNFLEAEVAAKFTNRDYLFLAADTMRARLLFNAIVHQYLIRPRFRDLRL